MRRFAVFNILFKPSSECAAHIFIFAQSVAVNVNFPSNATIMFAFVGYTFKISVVIGKNSKHNKIAAFFVIGAAMIMMFVLSFGVYPSGIENSVILITGGETPLKIALVEPAAETVCV